MEQLPDAPWIREAENLGMPPYDDFDVYCPVCGRECEELYLDEDDEVVGCDRCITSVDAYDWEAARRAREEDP